MTPSYVHFNDEVNEPCAENNDHASVGSTRNQVNGVEGNEDGNDVFNDGNVEVDGDPEPFVTPVPSPARPKKRPKDDLSGMYDPIPEEPSNGERQSRFANVNPDFGHIPPRDEYFNGRPSGKNRRNKKPFPNYDCDPGDIHIKKEPIDNHTSTTQHAAYAPVSTQGLLGSDEILQLETYSQILAKAVDKKEFKKACNIPKRDTFEPMGSWYSNFFLACAVLGVFVPPAESLVRGNPMGSWWRITQKTHNDSSVPLMSNLIYYALKENCMNSENLLPIVTASRGNGYVALHNIMRTYHPRLIDRAKPRKQPMQ